MSFFMLVVIIKNIRIFIIILQDSFSFKGIILLFDFEAKIISR